MNDEVLEELEEMARVSSFIPQLWSKAALDAYCKSVFAQMLEPLPLLDRKVHGFKLRDILARDVEALFELLPPEHGIRIDSSIYSGPCSCPINCEPLTPHLVLRRNVSGAERVQFVPVRASLEYWQRQLAWIMS